MQKMYSKFLSILLTVCMIGSMLPTVAFADDGIQDSGMPLGVSNITAFADLAEEVAVQQVAIGTPLKELTLPNTLSVTVIKVPEATETVSESDATTDSGAQKPEIQQEETTVGVSDWVANPSYDGKTAGGYTFTPTLTIPEGITFADGVTAPQITVTVEEATTPMLRGADMQLLGTDTDIDLSTLTADASTSKWSYDSMNHLLKLTAADTTYTLGGTATGMGVEVTAEGVTVELNDVNITGVDVPSPNIYVPDMMKYYLDKGAFPLFSRNANYSLNIIVKSGTTNTITCITGNGIYAEGALTLNDTGKLTIVSEGSDGGISVYGGSCTIDGPEVTSVGANGKKPMGMHGGNLNISSGSLKLKNVWNNYEAALGDNGEILLVTVNSGASLTTVKGTGVGYGYLAGTQSKTTITNNGGTVYIDGNVAGKAINSSGTFTVIGAVASFEGEITKPVVPDVTVNLNNAEASTEDYDVVTTGHTNFNELQNTYGTFTKFLVAKKAANFTLTGSSDSTYWVDENDTSTYVFDDMAIGSYAIRAYSVTVKGTNSSGGTEYAGNTGGVNYSGNGTLHIVCSDSNGSEGIGLDADDGGLTLDGPVLTVSGYESAVKNLIVKSGSVTADGKVSFLYMQGGTAIFDDTSSNKNTNVWTVEHTAGQLKITTLGTLDDEASNTAPSISAVFAENGGSNVADTYLWGHSSYTVTKPTDPVRSGSVFTGWYSDDTLQSPASFGDITNNQTYYAKWNDNAPALSNGSVYARCSDTLASVDFYSTAAGTTYYLVKNKGEMPAPTKEQVQAGTEYGWRINSGASGMEISLTAGAKDIYIVLKDAEGNVSEPLKIEAAALAPAEVISIGGTAVDWTFYFGTPGMPHMASINVPNSVSVISASQITVSDGSTATVYTDPQFSTPGTVSLEMDTLQYVYIEVTNGQTKVYYSVEVTRQGSGGATTYPITVTSGTANPTTAAQGATIIIMANAVTSGQRFKEWTISPSVTFIDGTSKNSQTAKFIVPAENVTATATYENIPEGTTVVSGITLNKSSLSLYRNTSPNTATLVATVAPANATDKSVTWQSSNTAVATVDASGNVKAIGNGTANITATTTDGGYTAICTVTVSTYTSGGGSSSGGSSGGGSSDGGSSDNDDATIITPPTTTDNPTPPTEVTTTVKPTVSGDTVNATVTTETVNRAITKAQAEAKKNGTTENGIVVEIKVDTKNTTANNLSANLPKTSVDTLVNAGTNQLRITSEIADINLNLNTLKEIQKQVGVDVNVTAKKVDKNTLSANAKKLVGNRPVYDFSITGANGKKVDDFGKGKVSVSIPYTLGAGENPANVVAYYIDSTGKVTEMPNSVYDPITKTLGFVTDHFSMFAVGYKAVSMKFTDIANHWAKENIEFVVSRGLFSGTSATTFSPNTAMTRGMFVTTLGRLAEADVSKYTKSSFSDVKADAYYMGYVEWTNKNNIVNGTGDGKFAPDSSISREQMAVIIANYAKVIGFDLPKVHAENTFADSVKISTWAKDAIKTVQMAGIISGKNGNLFDPQGTATRAEVSAVLMRFVELAISTDTAKR